MTRYTHEKLYSMLDDRDKEIERLGRELNRVTRGDVSNVITTLGDALTEIGRLTRERDEIETRWRQLGEESDRLRAALEDACNMLEENYFPIMANRLRKVLRGGK